MSIFELVPQDCFCDSCNTAQEARSDILMVINRLWNATVQDIDGVDIDGEVLARKVLADCFLKTCLSGDTVEENVQRLNQFTDALYVTGLEVLGIGTLRHGQIDDSNCN